MNSANPRIASSSPAELHSTGGYHHVTLVSAGRTAHLAGQCPLDADESVVAPGDPLGQADRVAENALVALVSAGARPEDVIRSVVYVASAEPDVLAEVWHRLAEDSPIGAAFATASTLIGVTCLGYSGQLVEVDLTAALPEG